MDEAVNGTPASNRGVPLHVVSASKDDVVVSKRGAPSALGLPVLISTKAFGAALSVHAAELLAVVTAVTGTLLSTAWRSSALSMTGELASSIVTLELVLSLIACCITRWGLALLFSFRAGVLPRSTSILARCHSSGKKTRGLRLQSVVCKGDLLLEVRKAATSQKLTFTRF